MATKEFQDALLTHLSNTTDGLLSHQAVVRIALEHARQPFDANAYDRLDPTQMRLMYSLMNLINDIELEVLDGLKR